MISPDQIQSIAGGNVIGSDGDKIGSVGQVYLDDQSGQPEWVSVKTGLFGTSESFVPLSEAQVAGQDVQVPYTKDKVKDAPRVEADQHLDPDEEQELYRYYNVEGYTDTVGQGQQDTGRDTESGRDRSDEAMTRSEEQLHVGTETREAGRARLRKYIVTENVTTTVPVSREEVRVVREPITDANRGDAMSGGDLTEEEHEVTLHEEVPVVQKETVPVERVKLDTETVTGQQEVTEEVRKERIETDAADGDTTRRSNEDR